MHAQFTPAYYMSETYAMEDLSKADGPPSYGNNQKGVYFWRPNDEWYFTSTMSRVPDASTSSGIGYISFVSDHEAKSYHPVGVSFGSDAQGNPFSIDMSAPGGDSVFIEVENVSDQDLTIRVSLKDVNENIIDTKPGTNPAKPWEGVLQMIVPKRSVAMHTFVYQGGFYGMYDANKVNTCNVFSNPANPSVPCGVKKTDFTHIAGANITINSIDPEKIRVTNAEIRIRKMQFGNPPPVVTNLHEAEVNTSYLLHSQLVRPSELLACKQAFVWMRLLNTNGQQLAEASHSSHFQLPALLPGFYLIQSDLGTQRLIVVP
jgi:hypothetical protein